MPYIKKNDHSLVYKFKIFFILLTLLLNLAAHASTRSFIIEAETAITSGEVEARTNPGRIVFTSWDADISNLPCFVGCAKITVNAPVSGYYLLDFYARSSPGSIKKGDGVDINLGELQNSRWTWGFSLNWRWVNFPKKFYLTAGNNTLTLGNYRPNTEIDKIRLNLRNYDRNGNIILNPGDAVLSGQTMIMGADDKTDKQVLYATDNSGVSDPDSGGSARFKTLIQRPGEYRIKVLAKALSPNVGSHNSLYISAGHLNRKTWHMDLTTDEYRWVEYPEYIRLSPGHHNLEIQGRESHTYVKRILLEWVNEPGDIFVIEAENTDYLINNITTVSDIEANNNKYIRSGSTEGKAFYKTFITEDGNYSLYVLARSTENSGLLEASIGDTSIGSLSLPVRNNFTWQSIQSSINLTGRKIRDLILNLKTDKIEIDRIALIRAESKNISFSDRKILADNTNTISGFSKSGTSIITSTSNQGEATYNVSIAETGNYRLKANVSTPSISANSFFISLGELDNAIWHMSRDLSNKNHWEEFKETIRLKAGSHILKFSGREINTKLNSFSLELVEYTTHRNKELLSTTDTTLVKSMPELSEALKNSLPGSTIEISDGTYSNANLLIGANVNGTINNPVIIKSKNRGNVIFSGNTSLKLYGSYVKIEGLIFNEVGDSSLNIIGSNNTFENNDVINSGSKSTSKILRIHNGSQSNIIKNNIFTGSKAITIGILVPMFGRSEPFPINNAIKNNTFKNIIDPFENGREAIQIGGNSAPYESLNTLVKENLFDNSSGDDEIISIKSNGNKIISNIVIDSKGAFVFRHSNRSIMQGNILINSSKGIRASGSYNKIINNYVYNRNGGYGLRMTKGCNLYEPFQNNLIAHNTFNLNAASLVALNWCKTDTTDEKINLSIKNNFFINNIFNIHTSENKQLFIENDLIISESFFTDNIFISNFVDTPSTDSSYLNLPKTGVTNKDILLPNKAVPYNDYFSNGIPVRSVLLTNAKIPSGSPAENNLFNFNIDTDINGKVRGNQPDTGAWELP